MSSYDMRNTTPQQRADLDRQFMPPPMTQQQFERQLMEQSRRPFMGQPPVQPFMPQQPMGVPPMGVPPTGFGPGVNNFGAAAGIGNPMQDIFQQFLSAQGAGGTGMPPIGEPMGGRRPYGVGGSNPYNTDPFKPLIQLRPTEQNLTPEQRASIEQERLRQNAYDNSGPTQEELARNNAQRDALMPQPMTFPSAGGFGTPPMGRDPFRRSDEGIPLWMQLGQPNPNQPTGIAGGIGTPPISQPMDRQRQPFQGYSPEMQAYYDKDRADQIEKVRRLGLTQDTSGGTGMPPMGVPSVGFAGGGTGMPFIGQPMGGGRQYGQSSYADPRPDTRPDPFKPLIQLGPGMPPAGGTPPMTQPPMGGLSYNDGFYNPPSAPRQPLTQPPAPMAMKKGGFAVKAVWDRKRPKDLGKPKDLSAKKEKSAKARAKAAGRPYPNLIDNMAAARKKGK